jgi:hypothetical protein
MFEGALLFSEVESAQRDTLSRAYPATMESNERSRTTEAEALASKETIQSLRDQMAKRETELATLRAELQRTLSETREGDVQSTITSLRVGAITVFEVIAEQLPDVFYGEIMPKIDMKDTLNLAQVSKRYNEVVWNVAGVRSFEAKIKAQLQRASRIDDCNEPMIWAAEYGNLPAIRAILQSGVDVNMTYSTWRKRTGLHLASEFDHMDAVKLLLEAGADPNIRDELGDTVLLNHLSCKHEFGENPLLVRALIQAGADVKIPSNRLNTPLHFTDSEACAMVLIDAGADIDAINGHGRSPLRTAICFQQSAVERLLRRFKAREIWGP